MENCGSAPRTVRPSVAVAVVLGLFACAWEPWIPGERSWNPEIVADPARLAQPLALDTRYVDELACYAPTCDKRFRLVLEESGILTVRGIFEPASQDQQARLVLEALSGVLDQAGTGRGEREDVAPVTVRQRVAKGTYFVLVQSVGGGRMPYELIATLTPGEGPAPSPAPVPETAAPEGPPPRFTEVSSGRTGGAGYDPEVDFASLRTFTFPAPSAGSGLPAGTAVPSPHDRRVRRYLAEGLEMKGLRQAHGGESADLVVDFATGETTRSYPRIPFLYDRYDFENLGQGYLIDNTRGKLVVDLVDTRTDRIAWHGWSTFGLGPGIVYAEDAEPEIRRAVAEALAQFPPF